MEKGRILIILFLISTIIWGKSIHQWEYEKHKDDINRGTPRISQVRGISSVSSTVFGFLPYWKVSTVTLHLDLLTHIALFCYEFDPIDGSIGNTHGWPSSTLTADAHAAGVKVVIVVTNFGTGYDYSGFLDDTTARSNLISNLVNEVSSNDLDGVNIDFESISSSQKAAFVSFISDLNSALKTEDPSYELTLCGHAVDWSGAYDYDQLALNSDGIFIMAYDYHWSAGPTAGPIAPLNPSATWGTYCVDWTINDYIEWGIYRDKFILGLPLYGYDWPVSSQGIPASTTSAGVTVQYDAANTNGEDLGILWNYDGESPYYIYNDGAEHQCWYENPTSLEKKIDKTLDYGLQGIGFWALGYEGSREDPWSIIRDKFYDDFPDEDLIVYPNPTSEYISLQLDDNVIVDVQLWEISGALIKNWQGADNSSSLRMENKEGQLLPPGVYIISITTGEEKRWAKIALVPKN